jgi:hypothetical protein
MMADKLARKIAVVTGGSTVMPRSAQTHLEMFASKVIPAFR